MNISRYWITPCGRYSVKLNESPLSRIDTMCTSAGEIETGGILIGYYSIDMATAVIMEALPPSNDSDNGSSWFNRGIKGLRRLLIYRWKMPRRTYYIGEWHYHPNKVVEPSSIDFNQMHQISIDTRYQCKDPILFIIGQASHGGKRPIRAFLFKKNESYIEFNEIEKKCAH